MKKITFLFLLIFSLFWSGSVSACSLIADYNYPTVDSVLLADDTAILLLQPMQDGSEVPAKIILGNENTPASVILKNDITSCSDRFDGFTTDEYVVAITSGSKTTINHSSADEQFSFTFTDLKKASEKHTELVKQWENRAVLITKNSDGEKKSSYTPTTYTLKPGLKDNDDVRALQTALKAKLGLGDEFTIDGSYGPATIAAVTKFQEMMELTADGLAGVMTQNKLSELLRVHKDEFVKQGDTTQTSSYTPKTYTLKPGLKDNDDVRALQTALKAKLGLGDEFTIDGSYGPATIAAVTKFQEMMELTADGLAGVTTQGKLAEVLLGNMTKTETEKKPKTKTTTASEAKTEKDSDVIANADIVNMELKKVLNRAKTEVNSFVNGTLNYTDAHSLVVGYNNEILEIYSKADPLYKSSFGGKYFVYFAQLTNGSYVCVDNSVNPLTEKISAPDLNVEKIEC